jgi:hypothetical protein
MQIIPSDAMDMARLVPAVAGNVIVAARPTSRVSITGPGSALTVRGWPADASVAEAGCCCLAWIEYVAQVNKHVA